MVLSCTVSEIRRLIGWKLRIFPTPLLLGALAPYLPLGISDEVNHEETRVMRLLNGESCMILTSSVFDWSTHVTDGQTDGRMDGRAIAYARYSILCCRAQKLPSGECPKNCSANSASFLPTAHTPMSLDNEPLSLECERLVFNPGPQQSNINCRLLFCIWSKNWQTAEKTTTGDLYCCNTDLTSHINVLTQIILIYIHCDNTDPHWIRHWYEVQCVKIILTFNIVNPSVLWRCKLGNNKKVIRPALTLYK